jgi:hypothetical protein
METLKTARQLVVEVANTVGVVKLPLASPNRGKVNTLAGLNVPDIYKWHGEAVSRQSRTATDSHHVVL